MTKKAILIGLWTALGLAAACGLFLIFILLQYSKFQSASDITGCYSGRVNGMDDKFCIYPSGRYEQFSSFGGEVEKKYNEGLWISYPYEYNKKYVNGVLAGYLHIDENGELVKTPSVNIIPYQGAFGLIATEVHDKFTGKRDNFYFQRWPKWMD